MQKFALVCLPAPSLARGVRLVDRGNPDFSIARVQHHRYRKQLQRMGFSLMVLPPQDRFPDSTFVEDPAVIIKNLLVITRLRREERQGEEAFVKEILAPFFPRRMVPTIPPGYLEGGDVLVTEQRLYLGLSQRTNREGAEQLADVAFWYFGMETIFVPLPETMLHLRGGASYVAPTARTPECVVVSEELAEFFADDSFPLVVIPSQERFGANVVASDGHAMVHTGCPTVFQKLKQRGFRVAAIDLSEFEKIDGAASCLSKLFIV